MGRRPTTERPCESHSVRQRVARGDSGSPRPPSPAVTTPRAHAHLLWADFPQCALGEVYSKHDGRVREGVAIPTSPLWSVCEKPASEAPCVPLGGGGVGQDSPAGPGLPRTVAGHFPAPFSSQCRAHTASLARALEGRLGQRAAGGQGAASPATALLSSRKSLLLRPEGAPGTSRRLLPSSLALSHLPLRGGRCVSQAIGGRAGSSQPAGAAWKVGWGAAHPAAWTPWTWFYPSPQRWPVHSGQEAQPAVPPPASRFPSSSSHGAPQSPHVSSVGFLRPEPFPSTSRATCPSQALRWCGCGGSMVLSAFHLVRESGADWTMRVGKAALGYPQTGWRLPAGGGGKGASARP